MKKNLFKTGALIINFINIIMMALLTGVSMTWANPDGSYKSYCSFFSLTLIGYGNWFPILTAGITIISTIILLLSKESKASFKLTIIALFISAISMITFNYSTMTVTGMIIASFLFISAIFQFVYFYK